MKLGFESTRVKLTAVLTPNLINSSITILRQKSSALNDAIEFRFVVSGVTQSYASLAVSKVNSERPAESSSWWQTPSRALPY